MVKLEPGAYYGRVQGSRTIDGLTFSESEYSPGQCVPRHEHVCPVLCLVVSGICTEAIGARELAYRPSTLNYLPAGEAHSARWHDSGGRCFFIEVAPARLKRAREHTPILDRPADFRGGAASSLAGRLYWEYRRPDGGSSLAMEGLALEILAEVSRPGAEVAERTPPRWLVLSLDEVAATVSVHPVHLARVFRRHFGCTPGDYLRRLRVESACRQLATTDTPLAEIALAAGFSDQSHLTNSLRRATGMTPGAFRRHFRPR
jgi:AraC family transcriptional regulator